MPCWLTGRLRWMRPPWPDAACRLIGIAARDAIAERGGFRLVLAGGSTPMATYETAGRQ